MELDMVENTIFGQRAQVILKSIVREYIRGGEPVGSRTLSRVSKMNLSPATVRNVMADLEHMGFLTSPHTSAGRVPSAKGFRFFVDNLVTSRAPDNSLVQRLRGDLHGDTVTDVMGSAAVAVSELTRFAGFVAAPSRGEAKISRLRFVKLSSSRTLAVVVTSDGEIINRVFECRRPPRERDLSAAARFFNRHLCNLNFSEAKKRLRTEMRNLRAEISALLSDMLQNIDDKLPSESPRLQMAGELNLLNQRELTDDVRRLRKLYRLFNEKQEFLDIIDRSSRGEEVRVFIGSECGHEALAECSVVLSSFGASDGAEPLGWLGIIGPKRMRYPQVISTVDVAAKTVAGALQRFRQES